MSFPYIFSVGDIKNWASRDPHEGFGDHFLILFRNNLKRILVCIVHKLSLEECLCQKSAFSRILSEIQYKCGKIMKFREKFLKCPKIAVRETLFSEACIWSNICRIWMKSGWSERSISVVSDLFYGVFVGHFAASEF